MSEACDFQSCVVHWWVANQWEFFKIKEGSCGYEFTKHDKDGNEIIDRSQKWAKMRHTTHLKEVYLVRYANKIRLFCRNYDDANRIKYASCLWLKENLNLNIDSLNVKISNLKKRLFDISWY